MCGSSASCASSGSSATLVRNVLAGAGVPPAPERGASSWRAFLRQHGDSILGCDLFTVDTVWLRRLYVLFFVSIGRRRVEYAACTSNPDTAWMTQQARNLLMDLDDRTQRPRFLIHDRDTKFSRAFDSIFRSEGIDIVRTPIQAPNANAYAERWVGSVRRECLDRLLIFGRRQLAHVLRVYIRHFNQARPHRALDLEAPNRGNGTDRPPTATLHTPQVRRRDLLGGLLHEYEAAA
jgi:putative transposase